MTRNISQGAGKFTPKVWGELNDLIRFVERDGASLSKLMRRKKNGIGQSVKIVLAKITGYTPDPREEYGQLDGCMSSDADKWVVNRWVYDWEMYVPEPSNSDRFIAAGSAAGEDVRFKLWGSYGVTNNGLGPAYNLMEQNNRSCGSLQDLRHDDKYAWLHGTQDCRDQDEGHGPLHEGGDTPTSAPGWPPVGGLEGETYNGVNHATYGNDQAFLLPVDWNVQPIAGDPLVVMYLVRTDRSADFDSLEGGEVADIDRHGIVPCFFLTNAIGPCHFNTSSGTWGGRGNTCTNNA